MLEIILFQFFMPLFVNPADPDSGQGYRSGISEVGHSYSTDKPATEYPMLTIHNLAYDIEHNFLQPGIYAVDLIPETKTLLFLQGRKIVAKSPVVQIISLDEKHGVAVPVVNVAFIKDGRIYIVYKNKDIEAHGFLYLSEN